MCAGAAQEAALPDVIAWARQGLKELSAEHAARVQWDSVGLAGHSRGGTVAYHQLQQLAIVKAAVLLDPVREPHRTISPTQKPLFVVGAGLAWLLYHLRAVQRALRQSAALTVVDDERCMCSRARALCVCSGKTGPQELCVWAVSGRGSGAAASSGPCAILARAPLVATPR